MLDKIIIVAWIIGFIGILFWIPRFVNWDQSRDKWLQRQNKKNERYRNGRKF